MKRFLTFIIYASSLITALTGCNNSSGSSGSSVTTTGTTCSSGYVYSAQYGCLAQSTCSSGYALYNNQCVYIGSTSSTICPSGYILSNNTCILSTNTTVSSCQGSCGAGYVRTAYGCLPQNTCSACYGSYNRYCIGGSQTGGSWYYNPY